MEVRRLRASDDRATFRSGDEALDRFFRRFAGQNQFRHHLGVTYVAVEGEHLLGFATVAPRHLEIEALPAAARKGLPACPVPVLGLARLAVDQAAQRQGVGAALLRTVLLLAHELSEDVGCAGVVVDAKPDAVSFYEKLGFMALDVIEGESDARPRLTAMSLPIGAIQAARRK